MQWNRAITHLKGAGYCRPWPTQTVSLVTISIAHLDRTYPPSTWFRCQNGWSVKPLWIDEYKRLARNVTGNENWNVTYELTCNFCHDWPRRQTHKRSNRNKVRYSYKVHTFDVSPFPFHICPFLGRKTLGKKGWKVSKLTVLYVLTQC